MLESLYPAEASRAPMGTKVLYMEERRGQEPDPNYLREFGATVVERGPDFVVLDQTAFYAEGGGQPYDTGTLTWPEMHFQVLEVPELQNQEPIGGSPDGRLRTRSVTVETPLGKAGWVFGEAKVHKVMKEKGVIKHFVDRMPERDEVRGVVDWDRRYAHMRHHTSQHLMSGIVWSVFAARTVGNQLYADRARVDFQPANFTPEDLKRIEEECNRAIAEAIPVRIYEEDRVKIENEIGDRSLVDLIPKHITRLRVIRVGDRDYCPCGGTHLKNTAEIGRVHILERRSKGKDTDRIVYELGAAGP